MLVRLLCALLYLAWTAERNSETLLYNGMWRSPLKFFAPLWDSVPGLHQPAWNLLLFALAPLCYARADAFRRRAWPVDAALGLSVLTIALDFVWGVARGGSAYWSYYQLSTPLLALLAAVVLIGATGSSRDLKALGWTILAAALTRSGLALYFFFSFVYGTEPYPPLATSHDDSPLFVCAMVLVLAWALTRNRWQSWLAAGLVLLPIMAAIKVNNRRVAWLELAAAFLFLYLLMPDGPMRRRVNRWLIAFLPVFAIYAAIGWGRPGAAFAPLRAFGSTAGAQPDSSTLARHEENLNIILTYIQHPILGAGWGQKMVQASSYYAYFGGGFDVMYPYTPHNSLAALIAFTGVVGLFGTLLIIPVTAFLAARASPLARTAVDRTAAMTAVCYLPVFGIQAYADIGMQNLTAGLLLAVAIAVAGRASVWTGAWPSRGVRRRRRSRAPLPPSRRPAPVPARRDA